MQLIKGSWVIMFGITLLVTEGILERMIFELKSKRIQKIQLYVYLREKKIYIYTYINVCVYECLYVYMCADI